MAAPHEPAADRNWWEHLGDTQRPTPQPAAADSSTTR